MKINAKKIILMVIVFIMAVSVVGAIVYYNVQKASFIKDRDAFHEMLCTNSIDDVHKYEIQVITYSDEMNYKCVLDETDKKEFLTILNAIPKEEIVLGIQHVTREGHHVYFETPTDKLQIKIYEGIISFWYWDDVMGEQYSWRTFNIEDKDLMEFVNQLELLPMWEKD